MSEAQGTVKNWLELPTGNGKETFKLDFTELNQFESRIDEVRRANPLTLPDMIVDFTVAMSKVASLMGQLEVELKSAERELDMAESIALLERVEPILKEKKIKSSADTRKAQVTLDEDVKKARERVDILTAVSKLLSNKHQAVEMAYYSARKICEVSTLPMSVRNLAGSKS